MSELERNQLEEQEEAVGQVIELDVPISSRSMDDQEAQHDPLLDAVKESTARVKMTKVDKVDEPKRESRVVQDSEVSQPKAKTKAANSVSYTKRLYNILFLSGGDDGN